jgi:hypothetical protein
MSLVDQLFPQDQLEELGNRWHEDEPSSKRRKIAASVDGSSASGLALFASCQGWDVWPTSDEDSTPRVRRAQSASQPRTSTVRQAATAKAKAKARSNSCFPSFIEDSLLQNYLRQAHPKDRLRYSSKSETDTAVHDAQFTPGENSPGVKEESTSSPGSLIADTSSPASTESCPSPVAICDQFRSGPFGHIFAGLRCTDVERDMVEDLLKPMTSFSGTPEDDQTAVVNDEEAESDARRARDAQLLSIFPPLNDKVRHLFAPSPKASTTKALKLDEHETIRTETPSYKGLVIYEDDAPSIDDFFDFDLDEACI